MASGSLEQKYRILHQQYIALKEEHSQLKKAHAALIERNKEEFKLRKLLLQENSAIKKQMGQGELCDRDYANVLGLDTHGQVAQPQPDDSFDSQDGENQLLEGFLKVGVPAERAGASKAPQILAEFHSEVLSPSAKKLLPDFCFPRGVKFNPIRSASIGNDIDFPVQGRSNCYVFTLRSESGARETPEQFKLPNEDRQVLYCVCLKLAKVIGEYREWVHEEVYCLLTYLPLFEVQFAILKTLASVRRQCRPVDTLSPEELAILTCAKDYGGVFPEHTLQLPVLSLEFTLPSDLSFIDVQWLCAPLLSALALKQVFTVICAVLQEKSVVFFSQDLGLLSSCVLACQALIRPFKWPYIVLPVIPHNLNELLEAPVPLLAGTNARDLYRASAHVLFVQLDEPDVFYKLQTSELLLTEVCEPQTLYRQVMKHSKCPAKGTEKHCLVLAQLLREYFWGLLKQVPVSLACNSTELSQHLRARTATEDHSFIENLLQTQLFNNTLEEVLVLSHISDN